MSDISAGYSDRLNLAELVARIERQQAETRKFVAEHDKLAADQAKLNAGATKFRRERFLGPNPHRLRIGRIHRGNDPAAAAKLGIAVTRAS